MQIKKHNHLSFGTLLLASHCYCGDNTYNTNFQNTGFKESNNMNNLRVTINI